ncbi:DUF2505 family protein [Corynebacterium urealyticum]|uniref:DUF2505 family protein n=1 Tax=Corynebacterium urealyticum TaxID=43771 RepID=UPI0011E6857A|nr:DUF2505 family protein [Corynebacterium urealyticum]TYR16509.1 DUF2505 family protein [Corynebacterium urealyticum]TYR17400.1 DUF2505 family protein [Corynebacterium urealyticum]TYT20203.1 DUF2505 family protein [Corynebacterium urealyticum]
MAKKKTFKRTIALSPAEAYGVLSSEDYLLHVDQPTDGSTVEIVDSDIARTPEGQVTAHLQVEITPAAAAEGSAAESGAEEDSKQPMRLQQTTIVEPLTGETCVAETAMPLPQGLGEMRMHFTYTPQRKDPQSSDVVVEVSVDVSVPIPMVGGMIARKILGDADNTIDKGLGRIEAEGLSRR